MAGQSSTPIDNKAKVEAGVLVVERWILAHCAINGSSRWPSSMAV
jgi:hypothetical protein